MFINSSASILHLIYTRIADKWFFANFFSLFMLVATTLLIAFVVVFVLVFVLPYTQLLANMRWQHIRICSDNNWDINGQQQRRRNLIATMAMAASCCSYCYCCTAIFTLMERQIVQKINKKQCFDLMLRLVEVIVIDYCDKSIACSRSGRKWNPSVGRNFHF